MEKLNWGTIVCIGGKSNKKGKHYGHQAAIISPLSKDKKYTLMLP